MSSRVNFQSEIAAKIERDKKDKPSDWVIVPSGPGWVSLRYIGPTLEEQEERRNEHVPMED